MSHGCYDDQRWEGLGGGCRRSISNLTITRHMVKFAIGIERGEPVRHRLGGEKMSSQGIVSIIGQFFSEYKSGTPVRLKLVDAYLAYVMLTGIIQFVYCLLVGTFPFNSFLSGFISCVGSFILAGEKLLGVCCLMLCPSVGYCTFMND